MVLPPTGTRASARLWLRIAEFRCARSSRISEPSLVANPGRSFRFLMSIGSKSPLPNLAGALKRLRRSRGGGCCGRSWLGPRGFGFFVFALQVALAAFLFEHLIGLFTHKVSFTILL